MSSNGDNCYLDHATTSRPKAPGVVEEVARVLRVLSASPGRSHHRFAQEADNLQESVRQCVARTFGVEELGVAFVSGATHALNLVIKGLLKPGDHAVATCFDHNSVLRPLKRMEAYGCKMSIVRPLPGDDLVDAVVRQFRPYTRLLSVCHASNVCGTILPVAQIGREAQRRGILVLLDAAQSCGHLPIHLRDLPVDFAVVSGHKGLLGPPGVGCLLIKNRHVSLAPLLEGGTGHDSDNLAPAAIAPTCYEAGTQNLPAIAGLGAALRFATTDEYKRSLEQAKDAHSKFVARISDLPFVRILRPGFDLPALPILSFTMDELRPDKVARRLDEEFGIQTRAGLHCAPLMHEHLGTIPLGAVRVAFGHGMPPDASDRLFDALLSIGSCKRAE